MSMLLLLFIILTTANNIFKCWKVFEWAMGYQTNYLSSSASSNGYIQVFESDGDQFLIWTEYRCFKKFTVIGLWASTRNIFRVV